MTKQKLFSNAPDQDGEVNLMIILLIEDEPELLDIYKGQIEEAGFDCLVASGGEEAIKILQSDARIQLIVSDIKMVKPDGVTVINWIEQNRSSAQVIVISGTDPDDFISSVKLPTIYGVLLKPFDLHHLSLLIKRAGNFLNSIPAKPELQSYQFHVDSVPSHPNELCQLISDRLGWSKVSLFKADAKNEMFEFYGASRSWNSGAVFEPKASKILNYFLSEGLEEFFANCESDYRSKNLSWNPTRYNSPKCVILSLVSPTGTKFTVCASDLTSKGEAKLEELELFSGYVGKLFTNYWLKKWAISEVE